MNKLAAHIKETLHNRQRLLLLIVFVFAALNGLLLMLVEKIAPPDFYKIYNVAERLFSGDLKVDIIPPLYPLLMYPLGKLFCLFTEPSNAFILAGRLLALASAFGVLYLTYRFLEKIIGPTAILGLLYFSLSPWFLKLIIFPITDMPYLFLLVLFFHSLQRQASGAVTLAQVIAATLTRFEGILLLLSWFIHHFKWKKRNILILLLAAVPAGAGFLLFFYKFAPRFFAHLQHNILAKKTYLFIFQHPLEFLNIIYGNILFFVPFTYPYAAKMLMLAMVMTCFVYGIIRLYKINRPLTLALMAYEFFFMVAKGYLNTADPEREFRRLFSGLWILYVVAVIGCYFLLKKIKQHRRFRTAFMVVAGAALLVMTVSQDRPQFPLILPGLILLIPVLYFIITHFSLKKPVKILAAVVVSLFILQIYQASYGKSSTYVESYGRKGAYATAQWLRLARLKPGVKILYYTNKLMLEYYLGHAGISTGPDGDVVLDQFIAPILYSQEHRQALITMLMGTIAERNIDYVVFDYYVVNSPEFQRINDMQRILNEEHGNPKLFRIRHNLTYKGKNVGYVLKPVSRRK